MMIKEEEIKQDFKHLTTEFQSIPSQFNKHVKNLPKPHIDSFNYALSEGLSCVAENMKPVEFSLPKGSRVQLAMNNISVGKPSSDPSTLFKIDTRVFPAECRLNGSTYRAKINIRLNCIVDGKSIGVIDRCIGEIPIMVKSSACHLYNATPAELVKHHEESEEFGGYFIVNGLEKILRMLIIPRRNYPLVMTRNSWLKHGKSFSEYGVTIRCVRQDESAGRMVLHYLTNGTVKIMFDHRKELFFLPVVLLLKALHCCTDLEIYREMIKGKEGVSSYSETIITMLRQVQDEKLYNQDDVLEYIGERFRQKLRCPEWYTNKEVAQFLIKECVCVHLETSRDKFNLLIFMTRKLLAAVNGECCLESADNPMNHEVLLGGHLYLMLLKEKLQYWLESLKYIIDKKMNAVGKSFALDSKNLSLALKSTPDITKPMEYLLSTGTLISKTGLALQQNKGFAVLADKLNYMRYVSHFRCVHRGSFFQTMRTTSARKLLPESWGFICPVHTPDGTPCGLLNHISAACEIVTKITNEKAYESDGDLVKKLCDFGMTAFSCPPPVPYKDCYEVLLDGKLIGYVPITNENNPNLIDATKCVEKLRNQKSKTLPKFLEVCLIPYTGKPSQYHGLFLFTTPSRMMRPVINLKSKAIEYIGTMEQVYLNISVNAKEIYFMETTHMELNESNMLSFLASTTPMSDFNQSPRNLYQCQMCKQTMGTPLHSFPYRTDNKLYRLQTPQSPLFRTKSYDKYNIDNYPLGTNAIVAVISYTGYDMEDAMILNKASFERGFAHGVVYKNEWVNLLGRQRVPTLEFGRNREDAHLDGKIDLDGFAPIGTLLTHGSPLYSTIDKSTKVVKVINYHLHEDAYLERITISNCGNFEAQKACFCYRMPRNPIIGDKFASRHGQKGINSLKFQQADMPFTEGGMTPDIIFNPHGFPSRMTIGMMFESMAGKSAALHSLIHDASPFQFSEDISAVEYFGKLMEAAGYNYYGTERLYSGINGREIEADIFFGVIYYQRLRHMVADKFQVRTTGPIDNLTRQPVKGRKRAGGIRFGEMERDSLLAHGVSYLLQDRLFNCSDRSLTYACEKCGGLLSPLYCVPEESACASINRKWTCSVCKTGNHIQLVALPFVFRYLAAELASVNIKIILDIK